MKFNPPTYSSMIELSSAAVSEVKRLRLKQVSSNTGRLRLRVREVSCSGCTHQIVMGFETESSANDHVIESDDLDIVIDPKSFNYLDGLYIDFTEDLMGGAFRFQNPIASELCICGTSFNIEKAEGAEVTAP